MSLSRGSANAPLSFAYPFHGRVIEVILMARPEAGVSLESSVSRSVLLLVKSQVPFADDVRVVSELAQILGQEFLVKRQSPRLGAHQNLDYFVRSRTHLINKFIFLQVRSV